MMKLLLKAAAIVAALLGIMAVVTGLRALLGQFDPGYVTFPILISYNVLFGLFSIGVAYFIWKNHDRAIQLTVFITAVHAGVLILLLFVFNEVVAVQSIGAMKFRFGVWLLILLVQTAVKYSIQRRSAKQDLPGK